VKILAYVLFTALVFAVMKFLALPATFLIGYAVIAVGGLVMAFRDKVTTYAPAISATSSRDQEDAVRNVVGAFGNLNEEWQLVTTNTYRPPPSFESLNEWAVSPSGQLWIRQHGGTDNQLPRPCGSVDAHMARFGRP
jgi:hypothetical protein